MDAKMEFLVTQKLEMWRTIGEATMLWWVSAIVLCVSIIGAAWTCADRVETRSHLHVAAVCVMVFFTMIFTYGLLVIVYTHRFHADIVSLLGLPPGAKTPFDAELWFFRAAMYTGTANYLLVMATWIFMWVHFVSRLKERAPQLRVV